MQKKKKPNNNNICKIDIANDEARCYVLVNNPYEIKILITFELHIKIILKAFYICKSLLRKILFMSPLYGNPGTPFIPLMELARNFLFIWKR